MKTGALLVGTVLALLLLEGALRIVNPFRARIFYGNEIILPVNQRLDIDNQRNPRLPAHILHTKNSLGFRGPEPPADMASALSIVAVGGSTTECFYLPDGKTWPDLLSKRLSERFRNVWLNNAGLDGHSSFGHTILIEKYLIPRTRPKVVLLLVGVNDVGRHDLVEEDEKLLRHRRSDGLTARLKDRVRSVAVRSHIVSTALNVRRLNLARSLGVSHGALDLKSRRAVEVPESRIAEVLASHRAGLVEEYGGRLRRLVAQLRGAGITPILITQPFLVGAGVDPATGVNLARVELEPGDMFGIPFAHGTMNGELVWRVMEVYNDETREVGRSEGIFVVDLASLLPKDSRLFYDAFHFTEQGAEKLAEVVSAPLSAYLEERFGAWKR